MRWLTGIALIVCFSTIGTAGELLLANNGVSTQGNQQHCRIIKSENCRYLKCRSPSARSCERDCINEAEQNCEANSQITAQDACLNRTMRQCVDVTCSNSRHRNCVRDCLNAAMSEC